MRRLLLAVTFLSIFLFQNSLHAAPSMSYIDITSGDEISTTDPVLAAGTLDDSFSFLPSNWILQNWGLDLLDSYRIEYVIRLQYYYGVWPFGWWVDVDETSFYHSLSIPTIRTSVNLYTSEDGSSHTVYDEQDAEDIVNHFSNIEVAYLGTEHNNYTVAVTVEVSGDAYGILGSHQSIYVAWTHSPSHVVSVTEPPDPDLRQDYYDLGRGEWYSFSTPFRTPLDSEFTWMFRADNDGGPSPKGWVSVSVSTGLTILDSPGSGYSYDIVDIGEPIWNSEDEQIYSEYQLLDTWRSYDIGESELIYITLEAISSGDQWLKIRAHFDTPADGINIVADPSSSSETDQQGYYVYKIPVTVCTDECTNGQARCEDSQTLQFCGDYDSDPCLEWGGDTSCQNDGLHCNGTEYCDEGFAECAHTGDPCPDDGQWCNGEEVCNETQNRCDANNVPDCNDGIACTVDSCNESTSSCANEPSDTSCNDGKWCNGTEICHPSQGCQTGTPPDCDDGLFCNGQEFCDENADRCDSSNAPDCSDGVSCTVDSCNEQLNSYSCEHAKKHSLCDDGKWCNGQETCHITQGCQTGTPPDCDDGLFCNGQEFCDENGDRCESSSAPDCSDGVSCTQDQCNEITDSCDHSPNDTLCDDGLWCNGEESCHPTTGCQSGVDPCPSDGNSCTTDSCSELDDECENTCNASSEHDPCCNDPACFEDPVCSNQCHACDDNCDGCIQMTELFNFVELWYAGTIHMPDLIEAIDLWYSGTGC